MRINFIPVLVFLVLVVGGFVLYLSLNNRAASNPFHKTDIRSPTVSTQNNGEKLVFKNYGPAPELKGLTQWLNSGEVTSESLQGKVVLVNFWTYSCISCIRLIPSLDDWSKTYRDQGLVVLGVHTPEYAFEKVTDNVKNALTRYGISYPVAQDNNYALWNAYNNQFWPATYIIDREGKIVYARFGDGGEELIADAIQRLVGLPGGLAVPADKSIELTKTSSRTISFGVKHADVFASTEKPTTEEQVYTLPETMRRNAYALEGVWKLSDDKAALTQGFGRIRLSFNAARVQLAAQSIKPVSIKIKIDGKPQDEITIQEQKNYELFSASETGRHILEIEIPQPGFQATQFIFE